MSFLKCALLYQNDPLNSLFPAHQLPQTNEMESFFLTKKASMRSSQIKNLDSATQSKLIELNIEN